MIRRRVGDEFWLIAQDDHAQLAGRLAEQVGNRDFTLPAPREAMIRATARHDNGWKMHDEAPTLTDAGLPRDVFETDGVDAHEMWLRSARQDGLAAYERLLVTLHQFHLSAQSVPPPVPNAKPFEVDQLRRQFETNKFQHAMIEQVEALRGELGLATDRPLRLGLADGWTSPDEAALRHHFRLLQALDGLSLAVCCTRPPRTRLAPLHERPGAPETALSVERPSASRLIVSPWPFADQAVHASIPYRAVPARAYGSPAELSATLEQAVVQRLDFEIVPE